MVPYIIQIYIMICLAYDYPPNHTLSILTILYMSMNLKLEHLVGVNDNITDHNITYPE
jgi:hypothetical protein